MQIQYQPGPSVVGISNFLTKNLIQIESAFSTINRASKGFEMKEIQDIESLHTAIHSQDFPFQISMPNNPPVECHTLLALLDYKRAVFIGKWDDKKVVVKFFMHPKRAAQQAFNEQRGLDILYKTNTPAPSFIYKGPSQIKDTFLVLLEYLPNAVSLKNVFTQTLAVEKQTDVLKKLIDVVAIQHKNGVMQHDCNLGNFILYNDKVYSLDGSRIFVHKNYQPMKRKKSLQYLAKQITYCNFTLPIPISDLLIHYVAARAWKDKKTDLRRMHHYLNKYRKRYHRKYLVNAINPDASKLQRLWISAKICLHNNI